MKFQLKFAIYSAIIKALVILAFGLIMPIIVQKVVYTHIDNRLIARKDMVVKKINIRGLDQALLDESCSYDDYNIFKEEFVHIAPLEVNPNVVPTASIENQIWNIEQTIQQEHRVIRQPFLYDNQWYELYIGEGLSEIDQLKITISKFTIWLMIFVILISVFVDIGFVKIMLKPFNKIVSTKLRATQDPTTYDFTPVRSSTDEFNYLDESINELMHKVKDAFAIEKEFISNVSHELLTPISILNSRLENIVSDSNTPHEVSEKIIESQKTLNRLSKIIKALLLISKIENAQYLKNETVEISTLVEEVISEIEERLQQKNIELKKLIYDDFTFSPCNKSLLHTLIFNLINNAIKYNKEDGTITITGRKKDHQYLLEIADTGIGIEKNQIDSVFDRFKKLKKGDENSYGLGLPIVKTIGVFHNLKIEVRSEINAGSSFIIHFPAS
ncbi:MAG: HAMP domain-containing sensor histidine kinase [Bacteroidia bacterium]